MTEEDIVIRPVARRIHSKQQDLGIEVSDSRRRNVVQSIAALQ